MNSPLQRYWMVAMSALFLGVGAGSLSAQQHKGNVWSSIRENDIPAVGTRYIVPTTYKTFKLDLVTLQNILASAPLERTPIASVTQTLLQLPMPDGSLKLFDIVESPVMEPGLAAQFPDINTYAGVGVDDPGMYVRLDLTPQGFHAMIMIAGGNTVFIDPYSFGGGDRDHYVVYHRKDYRSAVNKVFECGVVAPPNHGSTNTPNIKSFGTCELRTYRLALAATGEYTAFHGGTVAGAQAAQVTTMNRVNGVYETDMAIHMNIIANNNLIIYTNASTDPYTNNDGFTMLTENTSNLSSVIGTSNFDLGHVFSTGGGGVAGLGVVCNTSNKARGVTGSPAPVGDAFDIDYVCHEMGHQFACNHTFNSASGSCGGGNRNNSTAYEPGSGSTIMAYAGICSPHDVQSNSDDHFHGGSLQEMGAFVTGGSHTCPVKTPLSNAAPSITSPTAGTTYNIPANTMFFLTATATDANPSNVLTYCWEQMNNGIAAAQPPASTETTAPLFRSYSPTTSPTRYFPRLSDVVAGTVSSWEVLPTVSRSMSFRLTVRDNAPGGGCNDHEDVTVSVTGSAGPFVETYPSNTGISWAGNSNQTITWNVAGTTAAPISCANVDILLSTDGGLTYPTVLASNTPNDGSQTIICPNTPSTTARVMIVCSNNVFYDISNNNFTITAATNDYTLTCSTPSASVCAPTSAVYPINIGSIGGYNSAVTLSLSGNPSGTTTSFSTNPVTPVGSSNLTVGNIGAAAPGTYNMTLTATSASGTKTLPLTLVIATAPGTATLSTPAAGATGQSLTPAFAWSVVSGSGISYEIEIASDAAFASIVQTASGLTTNSYTASPALNVNTTYHWRVRAASACGNGSYSGSSSFTTGNTACTTVAATTVPVAISATGTPTVTSTLPISVSAGATITDVNVLDLNGTHTYVSDLTISLASPQSTSVTLMTGLCTSNDNFDLNFDNSGTAYSSIPCPPTSGGTYQSQSALTAFNGQNPNGTWTLTVADGFNEDGGSLNGWSLNVCYSVAASCNLTASTSATAATCNGQCNGTATATPANGTAPYTYAWTGGRSGQTITGLCAGTYTVTVTDGAACTATSTVTVTQPNALVVSASSTPAACGGACTGTATATATGGTAPYTYAWTGGGNTQSVSGLCAGTYTVTVQDVNACVSTQNVTVTQPSSLTASASATAATCNGQCNGTATATPNGGTAPYTYAWTGGGNTQSVSGLCAGTYTVTVGDVAGCNTTTSVTVTQPNALVVSASSTPAACGGACTGTATATATGGTAPYTYAWTGGGNTQSVSGLCAGTYTVTVQDVNACVSTQNVTVTQPSSLTASASATAATCNGQCNGTATATPNGGTAPYTYAWTGGGNTQSVSGLCAGTYTVTVGDVAGCNTTTSVTVTQPNALVVSASSTPAACGGACTGTATATATGGTAPYTYAWTGGGNTQSVSGLCAGTYTVTVQDVNACVSTQNVTVTQPSSLTASASATAATCNGQCNGTATATPNGGTAPYTYAWTGGGNTQSVSGLCAGTYTVTVGDVAGCNTTTSVTVTQPNALVVSASSTPAACGGACTGTATATATGGTAPYTYAWTGGRSGQTITGLCAGTYTVTVQDVNACVSTQNVTVTQPSSLTASASATAATCNGQCNGTATATPNGGTAPYTYAWTGGGNTQSVSGLCAGTYTVTISDVGGCSGTANVTVSQPAALTAAINGSGLTCGTACTGSGTAVGTGGTAPYSYLWSTGVSTASASALCAGTHRVTITDVGGCVATATYAIAQSQASPLAATVTKTNMSCNGVADGVATVTASAGVAPYTYLWNNGQTTASISGLPQASYSVTVTDAAGCTIKKSILIISPASITITKSSTNTTCVGNDGTITVSATGGTGTKTFLWSNGATSTTITGLAVGTYTVTATDVNGCQKTASVTIANGCSVSISQTNATCNGACNGSATVNPAGGTPPYSYQWSSNAGSSTQAGVTGLCAGTYTVTVSDVVGVMVVSSVTITQPAATMTATVTKTNATCTGVCNGTASVAVSGGATPYSYQWSNGGTTNSTTGLCQATHYVTITDNNGCKLVKSFIVTQNALNLVGSSTPSSCAINGTATVAVSGTGVAPYTYLWANGGTSNSITGLAAGTYRVTVTDANGCAKSLNVNVANSCTMPNANGGDANPAFLGELIQEGSMTVYPNPNQGQFHIQIELPEYQEVTLRVQDVFGRTMQEHKAQGQTVLLPVDASNWSSGAYLIQCISTKGQLTTRVIIAH